MKLEEKLFKSFFYQFLIGVILSSLIIIFFILFTNSYIDKRTTQNIINLEIKYSKTNIKSANIILTSMLLKIQASLNEQILFYQRMADKIKNTDLIKLELNEDKFRCVYDYNEEFYNLNKDNLEYMGYWYINNEIKNLMILIIIKLRSR